MKIKLGTKLQLPLNKEYTEYSEFEVTNFAFYGDYSSFDSHKKLKYNTNFINKLKWLFSKNPITLDSQVGVRLKKVNNKE